MKYLDFDLLIERSQGLYRARVLGSPAGEASAEFTPPFAPSDVEAFFVQIGQTRSFETEETARIREFGQSLFNSVFSGAVRDRLRESMGEATSKGSGLRIRLRLVDVPELGNMPWEFIYDPGQSRFLALSRDTPIVRYLETQQTSLPFSVDPPLRILAMICGPKDFPRLDVEREWENLQASMKGLQERGLVVLDRLSPPTLPALRQQLRPDKYHILHFVGHGVFSKTSQDGFLMLENEQGEGSRISGRDLGIVLRDSHSLRLVMLNACEGARTALNDPFAGTAQSLIQVGIPAAIAMQFRITDKASITLAHEFYAALADGYPVDAALTEARKAIKTEGNDLEWGTPVLYMRSEDGRIFDISPSMLKQKQLSLSVQEKRWALEPGQAIELPLAISNRGITALRVALSLAGIPDGWASLPEAPLELRAGEQLHLAVKIDPPRSPESLPGHYTISLKAASQAGPQVEAADEVDLLVKPFHSLAGRLLPERIDSGKPAQVLVENRGNVDEDLTLELQSGPDLLVDPPQLRLQVGRGQKASAGFRARPARQPLFALKRMDPIAVEVRPQQGEPQTLTGQVTSPARLPVWILLLLLVPGLALLLFSLLSPRMVLVPNVADASLEDARSLLAAVPLKVGEIRQEFGPDGSDGFVLGTDPPKYTQVRKGTVVSLIVSKGACLVIVPGVTTLSEEQAKQQLESACESPLCLSPMTQQQADSKVPKGTVISSDPAAGTQLHCGDPVTLVVSAGAEADTDGDGMPDLWELQYGLNDKDPADAAGDMDNDQLTNLDEFRSKTDPRNPDTDGDGMLDGTEVAYDLNPNKNDADRDPDNDCRTNSDEIAKGLNPQEPEPYKVPEVQPGTQQLDAALLLQKRCLTVKDPQLVFSKDVAAGLVVGTDPVAGENAAPHTGIVLLISKGPFTLVPRPAPVIIDPGIFLLLKNTPTPAP